MNLDIIDHFYQRLEETKKALNIPTVEPLAQIIVDDNLRQTFANLVSGNYPKAANN